MAWNEMGVDVHPNPNHSEILWSFSSSLSERFLASIIVTNQVGLGVPKRRTGQDSPEKVPLVPGSPEGLGFIKISVRERPQVVPGEVPVG